MKTLFLFFCLSFLLACNNQQQSAFVGDAIEPATAVGTIPDESIYNLADTFLTQDNRAVHLRDLSGKPTVVSMIFTHCTYACPRLTADVQVIEKRLGKKSDEVNFVLVSFDPERDSPEELKKYQDKMMLDKNFILLHGDEDAVRTLSVLLNVQYQKNADGDFSHSNIISVLDKEGKLITQQEGISANHDGTIQAIEKLIGRNNS